VLFVVLGLTGCGEASIYGRWEYEDKGVSYGIRFYNEFRIDKYETSRNGGRTGGGTFLIKDNTITLTRTDGNYDIENMDFMGIRTGLRNHKKNEFEEKIRNSTMKEDSIEYWINNYFPVYDYTYNLSFKTLSLTRYTTETYKKKSDT